MNFKDDTEMEETFGNFNTFPPNWKEVSEAEVVRNTMFFRYPIERTEYRQMQAGFAGKLVCAKLFFFHDGSGVAMSDDRSTGKVTWYTFAACKHTYQALSPEQCQKKNIWHGGNCYYVSECTKCGFIRSVDSSD